MHLNKLLNILEKTLIISIIVVIIIFFLSSIGLLLNMDWSESDTYFFMLKRVLAIAIGIELVRFIDTYEIDTILEILIFLLARQLLHMEMEGDYEHLLVVVIGISIFIGLKMVLIKMNIKSLEKPRSESVIIDE